MEGLKNGQIFDRHFVGERSQLRLNENWISSEVRAQVETLNSKARHPAGEGFGTYCLRMFLSDVLGSQWVQSELNTDSDNPIRQMFGDTYSNLRVRLGTSTTESEALEISATLILGSQ